MLTIQHKLEVVKSKNLPATLLFIDFSQAFDSIHREKMKDILIIYRITTEIINVILMLYKNARSMVRSSIRIGSSWAALNSLNIIWKSNLSNKPKINFFRTTVETVLVYGSITWTLTTTLYTKKLIEPINACCVMH